MHLNTQNYKAHQRAHTQDHDDAIVERDVELDAVSHEQQIRKLDCAIRHVWRRHLRANEMYEAGITA